MSAITGRAAAYAERWMAGAYPVSATGLALYRVAYSTFMLAVLFPSYRWLSTYPDAFWAGPVGPFRLIHGFPPAPVLWASSSDTALGRLPTL